MIALVGYTGFVGSNIYVGGGIDVAYNSKNIEQAFRTKPDILIYAGLRAEKYLANTNPKTDMDLIEQAKENITKISPQKLVLISTIDVLKEPSGKDEYSVVDINGLQAYGRNRYRLEQWVRAQYPDALIIRLPGLFGINIKKNFIYDYIHVIPYMLKEEKYLELSAKAPELEQYYELQPNDFYRCRQITSEQKKLLKNTFQRLGFTALNFTDSRNIYQFYPLSRLRRDIDICLENHLTLWHPATEPVSVAEVYANLAGEAFQNEITSTPVYYDYRTCFAECFGGQNGYLMNKLEVLRAIKSFVESEVH